MAFEFFKNMSPEAQMGLLQTGLGILANNTGNYGRAGPAIGKGGLLGLQGYENAVKLKMMKEQQDQQAEMNKARLGIDQQTLDFNKTKFDAQQRQDAENRKMIERLFPDLLGQQPQSVAQQPVIQQGVPASGGMFKTQSYPNGPEIAGLNTAPVGAPAIQFATDANNIQQAPASSAGMETNYGAPQSVIGAARQRIQSDDPGASFARRGAALSLMGMKDEGTAIANFGKFLQEDKKNERDYLRGSVEMDAMTGDGWDKDKQQWFIPQSDGTRKYISGADHAENRNKYAHSGASKNTVNVDIGDKAYLKKGAELDAANTNEMLKTAKVAYKNSFALDRFIKNSDSAQGGALQPVISMAQNFFATFGFNPDSLKSTDEMQSALNSILESKMEEFGARGLTDQDMKILRDELPKINTSKDSRINVARIMQKAFDNDIREYDNRLKQEKILYPDKGQFIPQWLKAWRQRAVPQSAIEDGVDQETWDAMTNDEKALFR